MIVFLSGAGQLVLGVPAEPKGRAVVQPDGKPFTMHLRGDEYFSWHETGDGYVVVKDPSDAFWKYARPAAADVGFRAIPGARVGTANPSGYGLKKRELPDAALLREHIRKQREPVRGKPAGRRSATTAPATQQAALAAETLFDETEPVEPPQEVPVAGRGSVKNIVLLACFSNHWDGANNTVLAGYGPADVSVMSNLFNQTGFNLDGARGSVKDYYGEVSYGKFTLDSVVTVWVRLPREEGFYGGNSASSHNTNAAQMVADAIDAAAAAGFNFGQGDTDGDGWVDCLTVIHSGYGEEAGGDTNAIWSHKGSLRSVTTMNGVKMSAYHTEPAYRNDSGTGLTRIGVVCHEMGHFFGLPDTYDTGYSSEGLGNWDIMAGGTWNNSGIQPAHFSAWCKVNLGFARTVEIHSMTGMSLPRVEDNPVVGLLRDGTSAGEYFLVENRARNGFDNTAQIYPGLVVYHVAGTSSGNATNASPHPLVKLEEADGDDSLGFPGAAGSEPGDVWTAANGLAGGFRDQTGNTNTSAMLYQPNPAPYKPDFFYVRTNNPAYYTFNTLGSFSAAVSTMTFDATTLKTVVPSQNALPQPFTVAWRAASGATQYDIQEGARTTLASFSDGAETDDAMYDNWHLGGRVMRAVTNASHGGSACYALLSGNGSVHHLTLKTPFKVTTGTVISFYLRSHVGSGNGYLKCQVSNDGEETWKTLATISSSIDPWTLRTIAYADLEGQGILEGDTCVLRYIADIESSSGGSSAFPRYGFALDDISITGTEMAGYGGWTTLDGNVTATSYAIAAKPAGVYAYRVQAYANGAWQGYGPAGETTVGANHAPSFAGDPIAAAEARIGAAYAGNVGALVNESDVNDVLSFTKLAGPTWLTIAADGALSGLPSPSDIGFNTFTVRVTDLAGAYDDAQVAIFVSLPASALRTELMAYLPFDADFQDYSGRGNHPSQSNANSRAAGCLGEGYVLTNTAYLSFGMSPDLHLPDSTNSFSVSFWAKLPGGSYAGAPPFMANKDWSSDTTPGWALAAGPGTSGNGFFQMNFKEDSANARNYDSTSPALTNGWHHYLVVFSRATGSRNAFTYVDGVQVQSNALYASASSIEVSGLPLNIGQDGTGAGARGSWTHALMDDVAFWKRALGANEAAAIYAAGANGVALGYAAAAPVITNLTADFTLPYGASAGLGVAALSAVPVAYQWRLEGAPIAGATNGTHGLTNAAQAATLRYDVVLSNAYGAVTSPVVVVTLAASDCAVEIQSAHGTAVPAAGSHVFALGTVVTGSVSAIVPQGTTQYVCLGWSLAGNEPASGSTTQVVMTVTNPATLVWRWGTNYWVETAAGPNGSASPASAWQPAGVTTQMRASADAYYHFTGWSGSLSSSDNPLDLPVDAPRSIVATFGPNMAGRGTPEWWLARHGWTGDFEAAETNDFDGDGMAAWQEFVAGTDPTNGLSLFQIVGSAKHAGGPVISWTSESNRSYAIEWWTNLTAPSADLVTNVAATPPMNCYTDTLHNAQQAIFYRVRAKTTE